MEKKRERVQKLEKELQLPGFWQNKERAIEINREIKDLTAEISNLEKLDSELEELKELTKEKDLEEEIAQSLRAFEKKLCQEELKTFLSGKYDKGSAILSIYAGAGGQDAQDWATMLLRMYEKYCSSKNFEVKILHQSFGEGGGPEGRIGTKSVTLEIKGLFAFGFLKGESGVHRLVRISPFSAKKLRHTSFALVEVLPEISEEEMSKIKINPADLKIDIYKSSGPGGQNVNKRETAVRITHLPTKITVACQAERLQGLNREKAMKLLYSKLYQLKKIEREKEIARLKGGQVSIAWGNQIRSYILHPYKLVKDLRTKEETSDVEAVLGGDLDQFITAEIKLLKSSGNTL